jgi:acyl-CoA dehydrogenase
MNTATDPFQDIREAVRDLCNQFPAEYFRKIDEERGYPEASSKRSPRQAGLPR